MAVKLSSQAQLIQLLWKSANWFNWFSSMSSICKSLTCLSSCSLCSPPQPMLLLLTSIWINIFSVFSDACSLLYLDRHFLLTFQSQPFHAGLCNGSELPELNQSANYAMLLIIQMVKAQYNKYSEHYLHKVCTHWNVNMERNFIPLALNHI